MTTTSPIGHDARRNADQPLVSIIVNNYNYAAYLNDAIDSALSQTFASTEVLVVDDGSTDQSLGVISAYGNSIIPIIKSNGGQASALNAGFAACRGDIVLFLDADDVLLPGALTCVVPVFDGIQVSNVRWPMLIIDANGIKTGGTKPSVPPADGDFREHFLSRGPTNVPCSPTSGNAWSRSFLERVFPVPEDVYQLCADDYLYNLAPAFGELRTIAEPIGCYRIHGKNNYSGQSFSQTLHTELNNYDKQCSSLRATLERNGITVDVDAWKKHSWFHRLDCAVADINKVVPEQTSFVLIDGGAWNARGAFGRRQVRSFLEHEGEDWGPPLNSDIAIETFQSLQREGLDYFVIGWPDFWWFDEYASFFTHLAHTATCVLKNENVAIYKAASNAKAQFKPAISRANR